MQKSRVAFFRIFLLSLAVSFIFSGFAGNKPVRIAVSKLSPNYSGWLLQNDSLVIPVNLWRLPVDSAILALEGCSGLLLTGGEDIVPARYGKAGDTACEETDPARDTVEFLLLKRALETGMPVLGICRGGQLINVALGGTLYVDIPRDVGTSVAHRCEDYTTCFHSVSVLPGTMMFKITGSARDTVTTNHHQAVEKIAPALRPNAVSDDGLVEGIEWKEPQGKSFLIGVHWHPERMEKDNPLSGKIAGTFIHECRRYMHHDRTPGR
jgi:putative glutamine amidotransferase